MLRVFNNFIKMYPCNFILHVLIHCYMEWFFIYS